MSELGILPNPIPFGKYYLLERVNIGGMAEIFKAKAFGVEGFERLLAVKKILANIAEDEAFINMFIDEAKIAGQLNHPNIAQIFDLGKVEGSYFIALEYISGKDLKTIFERARRLGEKVSIPRICYILMKICEGLGHAHTKKDAQGADLNIVHRDVSPQNILISYEGEAKIIDFGIAKAQGKTSQTQVGILKGKFSYMSPEQVRGLHIDHRSDIFSLGIVLYEMLTLERLFLGESDFDTLEKIRKVEMSPPSLYNPHIPKELEDIVLKALAKSPEDRFQNAAEFDDALQRFMRNQGYYYTNKDLASYMKESFSADIEFENKKLEYYRSLNLQAPVDTPPVLPMTGAHIAVNANNGRPNVMPGLSWGDDEKDTQIYNRDTHAPDESIVESLIDADIIFSEDLDALHEDELETAEHHDPPTVEYNRDALSKSLEEFSFDDVPPSRKSSPGLPRQPMPTAQLPSIEPRRESSMTIPNAPMPQRGREKSSAPVILGVMALVIAVGGGLVFMLWPWPAEVNFAPTPADVTITVDDVQIFEGTAPHTYKIKPGIHAITISSEGYETYTLKQEFQSRVSYNIKRELKKAGDAAPDTSNNPTLLVTTTPADAVVEVDGKRFEQKSPKEIKDFAPGKYSLKIAATGYQTLQQELDLAEEGAKVEFSLVPLKFVADISSDPSRSSFELYDKDNGKLVTKGKTPEKVKDLDASKTYRLVISSKGKQDFEKLLDPSNDTERKIEAKLEDEQKAVASVTTPVKKDPEPVKKDPVRKDPVVKKDPEPVKKDPVVKKDPEPVKKDPPKKDPPTGVATLTIGSRPAARIFIDGKDTGKYTPLKDYKISATKHKIELVNEEFNLKKTYYVNLKPGESKRIINK